MGANKADGVVGVREFSRCYSEALPFKAEEFDEIVGQFSELAHFVRNSDKSKQILYRETSPVRRRQNRKRATTVDYTHSPQALESFPVTRAGSHPLPMSDSRLYLERTPNWQCVDWAG